MIPIQYGIFLFLINKNLLFRYTSRLRNSLGLNPQRIYNSQDTENTIIYAFILKIPSNNIVKLKLLKPTKKVKLRIFLIILL